MKRTLLDLISADTRLTRIASTKGGEYAGRCPWCGGRDRFRVWPYAERPGYWCRGCQRSGDAIQYLRDYKGMSFRQACDSLELGPDCAEPSPRSGQPSVSESGAPNETWQHSCRLWVERAARYLWTPKGKEALDYLRSRGLHDETIREAHLGFCPDTFFDEPEHWGLSRHEAKVVCLPRGIFIPWEAKGQLWCLRVRGLPGADFRYRTIKGSGNGLYGADRVRYQQPVVLTEGEIDALTVVQTSGYAAVATGSTTGSRTPLWTGLLARASEVLIAYDDDEAGNTHARYWLGLLEHAKRWRPPWGDVNEIALAGVDLRAWIADGFFIEELSAVCSMCSAQVEHYSPEGIAYCAAHYPQVSVPIERETVQDTQHASTYEEFMAVVQQIASVFPGSCAVHVDPPGYTLAEHVKHLSEQQRKHERQQWRSRRTVRSS